MSEYSGNIRKGDHCSGSDMKKQRPPLTTSNAALPVNYGAGQ